MKDSKFVEVNSRYAPGTPTFFHLILYETGKKKPLEVAHYRVRSIALKTVTDKDCLLGILIDRQKKLDGKTG